MHWITSDGGQRGTASPEEWEEVRERRWPCEHLPAVFRWACTGDYWWLLKAKAEGRNGGMTRGRGLVIFAFWGACIFAWPRVVHWLRHCLPWRRALEVISVPSQNVSSAHCIVPNYLILLILTSFSLHEANEGWSNYPVNTNKPNSRVETKQLVQGHTVMHRNQTRISMPHL